jgi:hypothetical protein
MIANYTAVLVDAKKYEVTANLSEGNPVTFFCVVSENETELDALVAFHLEYLANPTKVYEAAPAPPDLNSVIQEQQAIITALTTRITALEAK